MSATNDTQERFADYIAANIDLLASGALHLGRAEWKRIAASEAHRDALARALEDLSAEVEMAESVGICLPDRVPALKAREALAAAPTREEEQEPS